MRVFDNKTVGRGIADHSGGMRFRLHFVNAQEMMEKVLEISMTRDWRLNEIYLEKSSLDTIFAKLSKK